MSDFKTAAEEEQNAGNDNNMFNHDFSHDEHEEDFSVQDFSFPTSQEEEQQQQQQQQTPPANDDNPDDDDNFSFDDDDDNPGDNNNNDDDLDLEDFNKKLGTDFKSADDLKRALKKEDTVDEKAQEQRTFQQNQGNIDRFNGYLKLDDRELVRLDITAAFVQEKKDVNDPEIIQQIDEKLDALEDLNDIKSRANLIRTNLQSAVNKYNSENSSLQGKWDAETQKIADNNREQLQNALAGIKQKGEFFGVAVDNDTLKRVYRDITSGRLFDKINSDQGIIAELGLFLEFREQISKNSGGPTYSDGVKAVINQLPGGQQSQRQFTQAKGGTGNNDTALDRVNKFTA